MEKVNKIIKNVINEYLDKKYMKPLYDLINDRNDNSNKNWYGNLMNSLSNSNIYTNEKNGHRYAFTKPEIIKSKWLIHLGSPWIFNQGFTRAFPKKYIDYLCATGYFSFYDCSEGYSFAFDADEKNIDSCVEDLKGDAPIAQDVTMFIASGIKTRNTVFNKYGDEVIFFNKTAHDFVKIYNRDNDEDYFRYKWNILSKSGPNQKILYANNNLSNVIKWVKNNYAQYRKQITNRREYYVSHKNSLPFDEKYGLDT